MLHLLPSSGVYIYLKIKCCLLGFGGCSVVYKVQIFDSCFIYQLDREQTKENGREKKREEKEQKKRNKRKGKRKREKERKRKKKKIKNLRVEKKLKKGIERNITWNRIGQLYLIPES